MTNKDKMIENIKNYSDEIVTLKDFITAVRRVPGMYLEGTNDRGFLGMFREVLQNAFDELNRDNSPANHVSIIYDERTITSTIEDNGRGIPFNKMIDIFSKQHTSSNYTKELGAFSAGVNGVGAKITNALSTWFTAESYILGEARKVEFIEGYVSNKGVQKIPNKNNTQGTIVSFQPSIEVMGEINVTVNDVIKLLDLLVPLTKIGSVVDFIGIDINGKEVKRKFISQDGILTYLVRKTVSPLITPLVYFQDTGEMKAEIAFTYDASDFQDEDIIAFGNSCFTSKGTHVKGFLDGLCKYFKDYMNKIYLANNKKITVIDSDIKTGLKAAVSVAHLYPKFIGQDKDELDNRDIYPFVKFLTSNYLEQWSREFPSDLQKLCKYFKDVATIRLKADSSKAKLASTYKASTLTGLPDKYDKPTGKTNLELIICEGDSAKGQAVNDRDASKQGIFPIRGKLPNAFTTATKEFLDNQEVNAIISLVGGGYGKNFNIKKVPWEAIVLMADADKDGCHIDNLLLKLFLLYMRPIIENGMLYRAVPPLFGATKNGKKIYFTDRLDFVKYTQKIFMKNNTISGTNGKNLTQLEVMDLLFKNVDYTYELERIAHRYALNPLLLELICLYLSDYKLLSKEVKRTFRFMNTDKNGNTVVVSGLIDGKYQTAFINDQFLSDIDEVIKIVHANQYKYYLLNQEPSSIYTIMKAFESNKLNVSRYKGLGQMKNGELGESTLRPDSDRVLIRYTIEDAVKEIEQIRYLESNKFELIRDVQVSRFDIL